MDAAEAVSTLKSSTIVELLPATESQARPLTQLEPEDQAAAWQQAVETAPNGKVTAAHVQQVVDEYKASTHDEYYESLAESLAEDEEGSARTRKNEARRGGWFTIAFTNALRIGG